MAFISAMISETNKDGTEGAIQCEFSVNVKHIYHFEPIPEEERTLVFLGDYDEGFVINESYESFKERLKYGLLTQATFIDC